MSLIKPCNYCGTYCNYTASNEVISMVKINELRSKIKDTKTGVMDRAVCSYCGTVNIKWKDKKIKCNYCGELL